MLSIPSIVPIRNIVKGVFGGTTGKLDTTSRISKKDIDPRSGNESPSPGMDLELAFGAKPLCFVAFSKTMPAVRGGSLRGGLASFDRHQGESRSIGTMVIVQRIVPPRTVLLLQL